MCKSPASPEIPTRGHAHGAVEKRERSEQGLCGKIGQKAVNRKLLHIAQGVCRKIWAEKGRKGAADKLRPSPEWQAPPFRVIPRSEASLALPLGELSPKVTERALQALLNGNSNQLNICFREYLKCQSNVSVFAVNGFHQQKQQYLLHLG